MMYGVIKELTNCIIEQTVSGREGLRSAYKKEWDDGEGETRETNN